MSFQSRSPGITQEVSPDIVFTLTDDGGSVIGYLISGPTNGHLDAGGFQFQAGFDYWIFTDVTYSDTNWHQGFTMTPILASSVPPLPNMGVAYPECFWNDQDAGVPEPGPPSYQFTKYETSGQHYAMAFAQLVGMTRSWFKSGTTDPNSTWSGPYLPTAGVAYYQVTTGTDPGPDPRFVTRQTRVN